jgi:hypothetical protein
LKRLNPSRGAAAKKRGNPAGTRHYVIDFVYADNNQQFGTEADLTDSERAEIEAYLERLQADAEITDAHVSESGPPVHQDFRELKTELAKALQGPS